MREIQLRGFSQFQKMWNSLLAGFVTWCRLLISYAPTRTRFLITFLLQFFFGGITFHLFFFFPKANRLIKILIKDGLFWGKSSCYETYFLHRDLLSVQLCAVQVCDAPGHFCARGHGYYAVAFCPRASCICDHLCTKYLCKQEEFRFGQRHFY